MTNNTQFKTLLNTWLNQKKPMITPSTHASFTLIAENHLIPYFGKRKIGSITEADIQSYIERREASFWEMDEFPCACTELEAAPLMKSLCPR